MPVIPLAMDPSNREWAYDDFLWTHSEAVGEETIWPTLRQFLTNPRGWIAEWGGSSPRTMITLTTRYIPGSLSVTTAGKSASAVAIMEGPPLPYEPPSDPDPIPGSVDGHGAPLSDWRITYTLLLEQRKCYIHFPVRLGSPENLRYVARIISQPAAIIAQVNGTPDSQKVVREVHGNGEPQPSPYTVEIEGFGSGHSEHDMASNAQYARSIRWAVQSACSHPTGSDHVAAVTPTQSLCDPACCTLVTQTTEVPSGSGLVKVQIGDAWYLCYLAAGNV